MKEVLIISGKGGTGKTTCVASIASLRNNIVVADCDVDTPDLHILLKPKILKQFEFRGGEIAHINKDLCTECGICREVCQFDAITEDYVVDVFSCEGCGLCEWKCPLGAIKMLEKTQGKYFISEIPNGKMVHAILEPAEENSGKLVAEVKKVAREIAKENKIEEILVDGAPGIGCPVIASFGNVDLVVIVTEPSVSGLHDLKRIVSLVEHFKVKAKMVINKFDLNLEKTKEIEDYALSKNIEIIARIPFSYEVIEALNKGLPIVKYKPESEVSKILKDLGNKLFFEE